MGEVADMILEGLLDSETGELIDGDAPGYSRTRGEFFGGKSSHRSWGKSGRHKKAAKEFKEASTLASQNGLSLMKHTPFHYSLRKPGGWIINVYPGKRRIHHDQKRGPAPFIDTKNIRWSLVEVVRLAIDADN